MMEIGDVVQLKSGGPKMTIATEEGELMVKCTWFENEKKKSGHFTLKTLEPYKEPIPQAGETFTSED